MKYFYEDTSSSDVSVKEKNISLNINNISSRLILDDNLKKDFLNINDLFIYIYKFIKKHKIFICNYINKQLNSSEYKMLSDIKFLTIDFDINLCKKLINIIDKGNLKIEYNNNRYIVNLIENDDNNLNKFKVDLEKYIELTLKKIQNTESSVSKSLILKLYKIVENILNIFITLIIKKKFSFDILNINNKEDENYNITDHINNINNEINKNNGYIYDDVFYQY